MFTLLLVVRRYLIYYVCVCVLFMHYVSEVEVMQPVMDGCALLFGILTRSLETTLQLPLATWHCGLNTHTQMRAAALQLSSVQGAVKWLSLSFRS